MRIKKPLSILLSCLLLFIAYKVAYFFIMDSQIKFDNVKPIIKLSQLVNISEERVDYHESNYIKDKFVGFTAIVDNHHFVSVTKLGKILNNYSINKTNKPPSESSEVYGLGTPNIEDFSGRYINLKKYPFKIKHVYYYIKNADSIKINQNRFYEIISNYTFLNISFKSENRKDFGYVGKKQKKSISMVLLNGDFYILNLSPIGKTQFKSLHELSSTKSF